MIVILGAKVKPKPFWEPVQIDKVTIGHITEKILLESGQPQISDWLIDVAYFEKNRYRKV